MGLFYLQRNSESQQIHDEFVRLIEDEQILAHDGSLSQSVSNAPPVQEEAHALCQDCDLLSMLHLKGLDHCVCGCEWIDGHCESDGE